MAKIVGRRPIELKISDQLNGYIPVFNSTTRLWGTTNKSDLTSGSAITSGSNTFIGNQIISGSLNVFQGITGSLLGTASYASNTWVVGGNPFNISESGQDRILGTLSNNNLVIYVSGSRVATFNASGSFILGSGIPDPFAEEKILINAGITTSYNLIKATSDTNNYSQFNIQNLSSGSNASSDIVATADNGSEIGQYINMGINGSNFTGSIGDANDAYLFSTGQDLHIGNASNYPVQIFAGGIDNNANRKLQLNPNNSHQMTGSLDVSGSVVAQSFTGSLQGTSSVAFSSSYASTASYANNFTVGGILTAQTIVVQTITSSTEFTTGSTKNGSLLTNTHEFTGSVGITGSLTVNGRNYINDSSSFESRITTNSSSLSNFSSSYINESSSFASRISTNSSSFASFSGSYINESSSFASRISTNSSSFANFSGSYINESSSFAGRITNNSSSFASFSGSYVNESASFADRIRVNSSSFADFSGSYVNESSSFTSRITTNSGSFASFSGSYINESSSFASRITTNSGSFASFSGSYINESSSFASRITTNSGSFASFSGSYINESSSFASRITTNSASISTLSASFNSFSGSFMTGSFTGSFTGSVLGTSSYTTQALSASNAATASSADNFIVRGTLTAQTINVQTITSSIEFNTGSTRNGTLLTNTHEFTGSVGITGSLAVNGSNVILTNQTSSMSVATASFVTLAQTASYVLQAVSASFSSTASSVNQLNQNVVVSGSLTISGSTNIIGSSGTTLLSSNADTLIFTGSLYASGSLEVNGRNYINDSSSFASRITTNSSSFSNFSGSYINESSSFASRITTNSSSFALFSGSYIVESSSFASRITTNSSSLASFSGSYINESSSFSSRITTNSSSFASFSGSYVNESSSFASRIATDSASFTTFSGSYINESSSFANRITTDSSSLVSFSGSYINESSSFASRITTNSSSFASFSGSYINESSSFASRIATDSASFTTFSGSYINESSSFASRITTDSASFTAFSGSYINESSSFANRIATDSASLALFSGSYINESSSFASRITTNSSNISSLSASFATFSGSFNTGSFTGSFTGSLLGTASYASQALSSSYAETSSYANNLTVAGILTAQTIVAQTITSSIEFVTGSTKNGSLLSNTHQFTGSVEITGSLVINGIDYNVTSGSTSTRLTNLEIFSGSYSTGSFTGSFIGRHTGSFSGSLYNLQNTVLGHIPFYSSSQVLADSIARQLDNGSGSFSIVINQDNITTAAPEALYVWQPSDISYNVIAGKGNLNNYLQLNIQNLNTGENASSDVVATANNGNESINYIDMGINSEGFTGSIGDANDAYLYSTGNHLHIGNASNQYVGFFAGGADVDTNMKLILSPDNRHEITGSLSITEKLNVIGGITASLQGTASWANNAVNSISSSYAINSTTASYALDANLLDGKDSSIFATTGSNAFKGNQTITGSFAVSGSTTQLGNNTLIGNTILSGSISITGSLGVNANLVSIQGPLRLDPATDPGTSNLTASFLFTSASNTATGFDLYYRQSNNIVKFKWLEGGLSTGILYGGVITYSGSTIFVSKGSGIINNLNASTGSEIAPIFNYVTWNDFTGSATYLTSSQNTFIYVDDTGVVRQQPEYFNPDQYREALPLGRVTHANYAAITGAGSNVQTTYDSDAQQNEFIRIFGPIKESGLLLSAQTGSMRLSIGAGQAYNFGGFYPQDPNHPSHYISSGFPTASIARAYRSGSAIRLDNNNGAFYTTVDSTNWDDGTGVLNSMASSEWQIQRVFVNPVTGRTVVYYGQTTYTTLLNAQQSLATDPFEEGEFTAKSLIFAGYLIVKGNTTNLSDTGDNSIIQSGIFRGTQGSSGGSIISTTLDSLSDVAISTPSNGQALIYNGGVWINGNLASASYAATASFVNGLSNGTSSFANTASFAVTASYLLGQIPSASYALTASYVNPLVQDLLVTGSVNIGGGGKLIASAVGGDEGGEILLGKAITNTTLTGSGVTIDVYQNRLRIFEQGGAARGAYLDISTLGTGVSTNLLGTAVSASYALTASIAATATSASYALSSSNALNAITASFSNDFTVANTLVIDQTLTDYHIVASSAAGENNMFNRITGSYSAGFFKYTVTNGTNARTGEVMAVWNGGSIQYTDNSTVDIGDTSGVVASAVIVSNSIQFNITTANSGWKLKSLGTFM